MHLRFLHAIRQTIADLRPYPSLIVVGVPLAIVEPAKLVAVAVMGNGHVITGTVAIVCAYAISLFVIERLFCIVKPKLLTLPWFAAIWRPFVRVRGRLLRWVGTRLGLKRKGLWAWDDGQ